MKSLKYAAALLVATVGVGSLVQLTSAQSSDDPTPVMVTLSEVHLCCGACVKAVEKAARIDGVQAEVSQDEGAVVLTAGSYKDVQSSIDEIAKAGFSGKIEDETQAAHVKFRAIKTPDGNVKKLSVRHIHNCCRGCSDAIIAAIESVDGVSSHTVKPKVEEFVVEGDFDAGAVVAAIEDAGLCPTLQ